MVTLRFAVPAILAAAAAAGCFTYFVIASLPARVEADARLLDVRSPTVPQFIRQVLSATGFDPSIDEPPNADEQAAAAYQEAAEAILRRAPNTRASAGADEPPITGPIPLPKRRPISALFRSPLASPTWGKPAVVSAALHCPS